MNHTDEMELLQELFSVPFTYVGDAGGQPLLDSDIERLEELATTTGYRRSWIIMLAVSWSLQQGFGKDGHPQLTDSACNVLNQLLDREKETNSWSGERWCPELGRMRACRLSVDPLTKAEVFVRWLPD